MRVIKGLKRAVLDDLMSSGLLTLDLVSHDNVEVAMGLKEGEKVFLTDRLGEDLKKGTIGIVAQVVKSEIREERARVPDIDERRILVARVQVSYVDLGRVTEVKGNEVKIAKHFLVF